MIRLIVIIFIVTAYCDSSCGKPPTNPAYALMASGKQTHQGAMACPSWMPLGTRVFVKGERFACEDRGGAIKGNRLDIWFPTCEEAMEWGREEIRAAVMLPRAGP